MSTCCAFSKSLTSLGLYYQHLMWFRGGGHVHATDAYPFDHELVILIIEAARNEIASGQ